jgi:hypothetical protein
MATSIMDVDSKRAMHILNLTFHIHDVGRALSPANFFMKALSNEVGTFMMWIVDGRFAHHIMNTHRRLAKCLNDVDSKARCQCIVYYPYS